MFLELAFICTVAYIIGYTLSYIAMNLNRAEPDLYSCGNIYVPTKYGWKCTGENVKRPLETVFMEDDLKERMNNFVNDFLNNKLWYNMKFIPYKMSVLIHGNFGDGKTSLVSAMADHFNLDVYNVSVTDEDIVTQIRTIPNDTSNIIVIENLDYELNQLGDRYSSVVTKLLSVMDGILGTQNQIVIVTATNLTDIPDELKRHGRFNMVLHVKPPTANIIEKYFKWFYETAGSTLAAKTFTDNVKSGVSMSVIQNHLIKYRTDPNGAVANANSIGF